MDVVPASDASKIDLNLAPFVTDPFWILSAQIAPRVGVFTYYTTELGRENYSSQSISGGFQVSF